MKLIDLSLLERLMGIETRVHKRECSAIVLRPFGFIVHEKPILEKCGCIVYALSKFQVDTVVAANMLRDALGRVSYCGLKDAYAATLQYVSSRARLEKPIHRRQGCRHVTIVRVNEGCVKPGRVARNEFSIALIPLGCKPELELEDPIPNFYGYQRFGSRRPNTHISGVYIALARIGLLLREFRTVYPHEKPVPGWYERLVLERLSSTRSPDAALKAMPRTIIELFASGLQAYLFNKLLSLLLREVGIDVCSLRCLPVPGCRGSMDVPSFVRYAVEYVLESEGLTQRDLCGFRRYGVNVKTTCRKPCIYAEGAAYVFVETRDAKILVVRFSLESGSFATTVLSEFMRLLEPYPDVLPH